MRQRVSWSRLPSTSDVGRSVGVHGYPRIWKGSFNGESTDTVQYWQRSSEVLAESRHLCLHPSRPACFPRSQLDLSCKEAPAHQSGGPVARICASSRGLAPSAVPTRGSTIDAAAAASATQYYCNAWAVVPAGSSWHSWSQKAGRAPGFSLGKRRRTNGANSPLQSSPSQEREWWLK